MNTKIILPLAVVAACVVIAGVISFRKPAPSDKGITIGSSSLPDTIKKYGSPSWQSTQNGNSIAGFESTGSGTFTTIRFDDAGKASLVVIQRPGIRFSDVRAVRGETEDVLYGYMSREGYALFIYPSAGEAYVANTEINEVAEKWTFAPMDFASFQKTYGAGLTTTLPDFRQ